MTRARVADDFLSHQLNFGALEEEWQEHLNVLFMQSKEHALPWTVEGNLELASSPEPRGGHMWSTSVQVAGPLQLAAAEQRAAHTAARLRLRLPAALTGFVLP